MHFYGSTYYFYHERYLGLYSSLLAIIQTQDPALGTEIISDIKKDVALDQSSSSARYKLFTEATAKEREKDRTEFRSRELNETVNLYDQVLQQWMGGNGTGAINGSYLMPDESAVQMFGPGVGGPRVMRFPAALPLNMLPLCLRGPELERSDVDLLKERVFRSDILNNSLVDFSTYLATFRGAVAANMSVKEAVEEARRRISSVPGLDQRVRLFVLPDYQTKNPGAMVEKYSGTPYDPIFTVVSSEALPRPNGAFEYVTGALVLLAAAGAVLGYSVDVYSLNSNFLQRALAGDVSVVGQVLPIVGGVFALQLTHDLGHYIAAAVHKVKLGLPLPLPSIQIGLFGSATRFLSFPADRKQLFDISVSGPALGFLCSLASLVAGLYLTSTATPAEQALFPALPLGFFTSSLLIHEITNSFLQISKLVDPTTLVPLHPLVTVAITGILANALNFMPIGRLDGGRVVMAVAGRQSANFVTFATLIAQGVSLFTNFNVLSLFWIVLVLLFQRSPDYPPQDDITPVATAEDDSKKSLAWITRAVSLGFCAVMAGATLLPVPPQPAAQQAAVTQAQRVENGLFQGMRSNSAAPSQSLRESQPFINEVGSSAPTI